MKTWTQDHRYIVWTVNENRTGYDLYVGGILKYENLPLDVFYPIYKKESEKVA